MTAVSDNPNTLVRTLLGLHRGTLNGVSSDRAMLAQLRQDSLTGRLQHTLPFVLRCGVHRREEDDAILFAQLFAANPAHAGKRSLASCLRRIAESKTDGSGARGTDPTERRLQHLLATPREDLGEGLRNLLALASPDELNWHNLYWSIRHWDDESTNLDSPKRRWARDYWSKEVTHFKANDEANGSHHEN